MDNTSAIKLACEDYIRISKELSENAKAMGTLRRMKNDYAEMIRSYLVAKNGTELQVQEANARLILKDSKRTESMSKDIVADVLRKHGLDAEKIINDIQSSRKSTVKQVISFKQNK